MKKAEDNNSAFGVSMGPQTAVKDGIDLTHETTRNIDMLAGSSTSRSALYYVTTRLWGAGMRENSDLS